MRSSRSAAGGSVAELLRAGAAEGAATALVVLAGPGLLVFGGADVGSLEVAVGVGLAMAIAIGALGAVANPMFSLALWFAKAITLREAVSDWVGQFLGAIAGAAILWGLADGSLTAGVNGWAPDNGIDAGVDVGITTGPFAELGVVIGAELVFGVILTIVLLAAIKEQRANATSAALVGAASTLATLFLLPLSGAGVNPARSVGMAIFADTDPGALGQVWVFVVVPVLAAVAGLMVWLAIDEATIDDTVFDDTVVESVTDAATDLVT